jgi:hypothetical protein
MEGSLSVKSATNRSMVWEREPLLGAELMTGYLLQVEFEDGGEVSL